MTLTTHYSNIPNNNDFRTAVSNFLDNYQNSLGATISQSEVNDLLQYVDKNIFNSTNSKIICSCVFIINAARQ